MGSFVENVNKMANLTPTNVEDLSLIVQNIDAINQVAPLADDLNDIIDNIMPNLAEILDADNNAIIATEQALLATTQTVIATEQATIATIQAGTAITKAEEASYYATITNYAIVETLAELEVLDTTQHNNICVVKDLNRGGTFVWSPTGIANGGTVFAGATGFWNRQYDGAVNVKWFGAVGDGVTDDTVAFQNAHDAVLNLGGGVVRIPTGHYRVQGVEFAPGVLWKGEGHLATRVQVIDSPLAGVGIFRCIGDADEFTSILFEDFAIIGDGISSLYKPSGATVPGIDFSTNAADAQINQCYFSRLFIQFCTTGIHLYRSVRQAPISGCRFWHNNLGLYIGNEHPVLEACEFRYNDIGVDGTIQDMDVMHSRFAYNRVGWRAETSRSAFVSCKFWQNKEVGIERLAEYNHFSSCIFRGAGTFWSNIDGSTNESVCIGWNSRGNTITSSLFWGGNGRAMIELRSTNVQVGGGVSDSTVILSDGHFLEKVGSGAYTGFKLNDNNFIVTSVGDADGAMIVRVPSNVSGMFAYFKFHDNFIRNEGVTQTHDFIEIAQTIAGGHTFHGNTFQSQSGICGGINVYDNASTQYIGNTFRSGNYLNKIYIRSKQAGMSVKDNVGFTSETSGTSAIPADATEVVVYHGLDVEPVLSSISITRGGGGGSASKYWIESMPGSGSFKIRCDVPPGQSPMTFYWNISSHRLI